MVQKIWTVRRHERLNASQRLLHRSDRPKRERWPQKVTHLQIRVIPVEVEALQFLNEGIGIAQIEIDARQNRVQQAAYAGNHVILAQIFSRCGMSERLVMMSRYHHFEKRCEHDRFPQYVVLDAPVEILPCFVIPPVIYLGYKIVRIGRSEERRVG